MRLLFTIVLSCFAITIFGQVTVSGVIKDSATKEPLVAANILQKGTSNGTTSDSSGAFTLVLEDLLPIQLEISFVGYDQYIFSVQDDSSRQYIILMELKTSKVIPIISSRVDAFPSNENFQLLNSSRSTTVINQNTLQQNDAFSFAPILNQVPGIFMHNGTLNTNRITIRGIGARSPFSTAKIRAYLNEIPLTSGDGETTIEDFDLTLFDKIAITKGPGNVEYGSGLGGTINLITLGTFNDKSYFSTQTQYGNFNTFSTINQFK